MTLENLTQEMYKSMKERDKIKKDTLSSAIGAIKKVAKDKRIENPSEQLVAEVLLKEKKIIEEMIATCPEDRAELLMELTQKKAILEGYCPKIISDETQIRNLILEIAETMSDGLDLSNKGAAMKILMPRLKGKVDMKVANQVISDLANK
jgi:uncharacterized protein YqeY